MCYYVCAYVSCVSLLCACVLKTNQICINLPIKRHLFLKSHSGFGLRQFFCAVEIELLWLLGYS